MTTTVTVATADHAANVTVRTKSEGEVGHNISDREERVEPHQTRDFHIYDSVQLLVVEDRTSPAPAEKIGEDDQD